MAVTTEKGHHPFRVSERAGRLSKISPRLELTMPARVVVKDVFRGSAVNRSLHDLASCRVVAIVDLVADVVHVVRRFRTCAPLKTHTHLTTTVNLGSPLLVKNSDRAASVYKYIGSRIAPNDLAKVGVAGSNPVVRSEQSTRSKHYRGSIVPSWRRPDEPTYLNCT
jgi:hypothetical protein